MKTEKKAGKKIATNRQAAFHYELGERFEAGLVLMGSEVKSLRAASANLNDAYVTFRRGEAYLSSAFIAPYAPAAQFNHEPTRMRKLLLHRQEIHKLMGRVQEKGLTLVPTRLFFNPKGKVKVEIALAKGKKVYDKRATIKKREADREIQRTLRRRST